MMEIIDCLRLSAEQGTPLQRLFVREVSDNRGVILSVIKCYGVPYPADTIQDILFQAWKSYGGFDGRSKFSTWLYKIATHVCIDAIRRRKVALRNLAIYEPVILPDDPVEWPPKLKAAFDRLSPDDQRFLQVYYSGIRAKQLGGNTGQLTVRAFRLKNKLKAAL